MLKRALLFDNPGTAWFELGFNSLQAAADRGHHLDAAIGVNGDAQGFAPVKVNSYWIVVVP